MGASTLSRSLLSSLHLFLPSSLSLLLGPICVIENAGTPEIKLCELGES